MSGIPYSFGVYLSALSSFLGPPQYSFSVLGAPIVCEFADLAAVPVNSNSDCPHFYMADAVEVLTPVVTIGYPNVSGSIERNALWHKGEINGEVKTTDGQEFLVISCSVSPGNSGGPVINELGELVGVVSRSATGEYLSDQADGTYKTTHHMAIPNRVTSRFLDLLK